MSLDLMKRPRTLNVACMPISLGLVQTAMADSGLKWVMHRAQWCALELQTVSSFVEFVEEREVRDVRPPFNFSHLSWLAGIPVEIDDEMPDSVMELRHDDTAIYRIECLPIPAAFLR